MAQKKDAACGVDVVESEARLDDLLKGKSGKKTMLGFLSKQYDARIVGRSYSYSMEAISQLNTEERTKTAKLE